MLKYLHIHGLRGFQKKQSLKFAVANGDRGSGYNVIVGGNNSGKSTISEAIRSLVVHPNPSFSQGRRNILAGDEIRIAALSDTGEVTAISSIRAGSSETTKKTRKGGIKDTKLLVLPSRRVFSPYFGQGEVDRRQYMRQYGFPTQRSSNLDAFTNRLFRIEKNKLPFDEVLKKVIDPVPDWSIDQSDQGQYFLKLKKGDSFHTSEGMGEGLISLLYIVDALYDSSPGDTIVIDEPELSLHPAILRKLAILFVEYSSDRQLIIFTHSPYFTAIEALRGGGALARTHIKGVESKISQASTETLNALGNLLGNVNNPHVLGLNAQEIFFIQDGIILVEGQEDVIFYSRILDQLDINLGGTFFGWGVGGAGNMRRISQLLFELGFQSVAGILDNNQRETADELSAAFPSYRYVAIPAEDVRTKPQVAARAAVVGLLDDNNQNVRPEHLASTQEVFQEIQAYLAR